METSFEHPKITYSAFMTYPFMDENFDTKIGSKFESKSLDMKWDQSAKIRIVKNQSIDLMYEFKSKDSTQLLLEFSGTLSN